MVGHCIGEHVSLSGVYFERGLFCFLKGKLLLQYFSVRNSTLFTRFVLSGEGNGYRIGRRSVDDSV